MMGHGKHDSCMMCSMGKAVGMIEKCTDKNCTNPMHKKEKEEEVKKVNSNKKIIFYGTTWCPDCRRSKTFLDEQKVEYDYIDIDKNRDAAEEVEKINNGMQSIPTIVFPNGKILVEPSNAELDQAFSI